MAIGTAFVAPLGVSAHRSVGLNVSSRSALLIRHARTRVTSKSPMMAMGLPELSVAANPGAVDAIAKAFGTLNLPTWAVEWGHPAMMGFMILGMGMPGAAFGWQGRLNEDKKAGLKQKTLHENIMVAFGLLAFLGGTGGTLSVAMQGYDIFQTPHAISAAVVLAALFANAVLAYSGFSIGSDGSPKAKLKGRTIHAYLGAATMAIFVIHAIIGVNVLLG